MSESLMHKRPVLVTGIHRSGTTWIGRMLSCAPNTYYIHEPFNVSDPPGVGICRIKFKYWYTYIDRFNEDKFYKGIRDLISLKYNFYKALTAVRSSSEFKKVFNENREFSQNRKNEATRLIKDPLAFFSAEWLHKNFNAIIIIVIRHPAAFVNSLVKLNWKHPFSHFANQRELLDKYLSEYRSLINAYTKTEYPILDQGILLWNIIYSTALRLREHNSNWLFVRHEDLGRNPVKEFCILYQKIGLDFTEDVKRKVLEYSTNMEDTSINPFNINRNSLLSSNKWKSSLSHQQIEYIQKGVENVSKHFYQKQDW